MNILIDCYKILPENVQTLARKLYYSSTSKTPFEEYHDGFVEEFFDSEREYQSYVDEFESGEIAEEIQQTLSEFEGIDDDIGLAGIGIESAADYYALIRSEKPERIVETGVCNGFSTLVALLAVEKNGNGEVYFIDYPFYADESLEEFRSETFEEYGGGAIPSDREPGWIIPDDLRDRWDLRLGKSQEKLPELAMELGEFDFFIHDSEHSFPCMMFEYEIAKEFLTEEGLLLSDDRLE